ncbi:ribosome silencing factor [Psychroflexus planctonicus]|uniref:Ribosomal silencing factor RsfS n=1 Tax=Psychroflexus planctonicus TaxID=1526575 RepID=A0ABQ1SIP3_9FLAO|nr:ribosome silencing factor [Psychroflexus planctonicus]GGE41354.1 ribosomal silencing factor RsfS [Psychroflexus planctonicus]
MNKINPDQQISLIIKGIEDVKGKDISILDLREIENTICDYFIICTGTSNTQVDAIVTSIRKTVSKDLQEKPWNIEGQSNSEWVLVDYVNIIVHVFQKQIREHYDIESLWGDAKLTQIETDY